MFELIDIIDTGKTALERLIYLIKLVNEKENSSMLKALIEEAEEEMSNTNTTLNEYDCLLNDIQCEIGNMDDWTKKEILKFLKELIKE